MTSERIHVRTGDDGANPPADQRGGKQWQKRRTADSVSPHSPAARAFDSRLRVRLCESEQKSKVEARTAYLIQRGEHLLGATGGHLRPRAALGHALFFSLIQSTH